MLLRYMLTVGALLTALPMTQGLCSHSCLDRDHDGYCETEDCDDHSSKVYPGAPEVCDGRDDDCDGVLPADEADADGDGYVVCTLEGSSSASSSGDCNDGDAAVHPHALEVCDGLDNDCDGQIPADEADADGDGYRGCATSTTPADCDDADVNRYPGALEVCDGLDNDCDGQVPVEEADADGDGFMVCQNGAAAADCDDLDPETYPGALEVCDGIDQDCDGLSDASTGGRPGWIRSVCGSILSGDTSADAQGDDQGTVLYNQQSGLFQMWFRMVDASSTTVCRIGYAESRDGAVWDKLPVPVMDVGLPGSWDAKRVGFPSVLLQNGVYKMWYQGQDDSDTLRIGFASSNDGQHWIRNATNPVLQPGASGAWDSKLLQAPSVAYDQLAHRYRMYYTGSDGVTLQTGVAESNDGLTWIRYAGNPVLRPGNPGEWDSKRVVFARVRLINGVYHMWYSGDDSSNSYTYDIGYASSLDGYNWNKLAGNPIFSPSASGFDSYMVYAADVIPVGGGFSMFYSGASSSSGPYGIGIARNVMPTVPAAVGPSAGFMSSIGLPAAPPPP